MKEKTCAHFKLIHASCISWGCMMCGVLFSASVHSSSSTARYCQKTYYERVYVFWYARYFGRSYKTSVAVWCSYALTLIQLNRAAAAFCFVLLFLMRQKCTWMLIFLESREPPDCYVVLYHILVSVLISNLYAQAFMFHYTY